MENQRPTEPQQDDDLQVEGWTAIYEPGAPRRIWVQTGDSEATSTPPVTPIDLAEYHNSNDPFYQDFV